MIYELSVYRTRDGMLEGRLSLVPGSRIYVRHRDHSQLLDEVDRIVAAYLRQEYAA